MAGLFVAALAVGVGAQAASAASYPNTVLADGVGVYYRLDEGANAVSAVDTSTTGAAQRHNATYLGGTRGQSGATTDGDKSVSNPSLTSSFSGEDEHSIEFWIKDVSSTDIGQLMNHGNQTGTKAGWQLYRFRDTDNTIRLAIVLTDQDVVLPCAAPSGSDWQMYVITWSGTTVTCYLNGVSAGSVTVGHAAVGAPPATAPSFNVLTTGSLDEFALYKSTLSAAQVAAHYAAGLQPVQNSAPFVSGPSLVGEGLTAHHGAWGGDDLGLGYSYQWLRCNSPALTSCTAIPLETEAGYTAQVSDAGQYLAAQVTAANPYGSVVVTTARTLVQSRTPVPVTGTVTDKGGVHPPADVYLKLWPSDLAQDDTATSIDTPVIASGKSSAVNGTFSLTPTVTPAVASAAAANNGIVPMMLEIVTKNKMTTIAVDRYLPATSSSVLANPPGDTSPNFAIDLSAISPTVAVGDLHCSAWHADLQHDSWTRVGQVHSWDDDHVIFHYARDNVTSTELKLELQSGSGNWQASGSYKIENSGSWGFEKDTRNDTGIDVFTQFHFVKYHRDCVTGTDQMIRATKPAGGSSYNSFYSPGEDGQCKNYPSVRRSPYAAGVSWWRSTDHASYVTGGVTVFGIGIQTRSGYNTHVQTHYSLPNTYTHWFCGDNGEPESSGQVFAGWKQ